MYMQGLVKIKNHCKKVNMQNIHKAGEIYFYHVIYSDLFPYVCAKNRQFDAQINKKILTAELQGKSFQIVKIGLFHSVLREL